MGSRRGDGNAPFNNPFAAEMRRLRKHLKRTRVVERARPAPSPQEADCDPLGREFSDVVPIGKGAGRVPPRPPAAAVAPGEPSFAEQLEGYPFDLRFTEGFIRARARGVSRETLRRLERGEFSVQAHLDLHGMAVADARECVDRFLADAHRQGKRCVLVITGKGRNSPCQKGVLHDQIPRWLARGPSARRVLAFASARACDGGIGALYVLLRRHGSRKNRIDVECGAGD